MNDFMIGPDSVLPCLPAFAEVCKTIANANDLAEQVAREGRTDHGETVDIAATAVFFGGQTTRRYCQWWETGAICHEGSRISGNSSGGVSWTHKGQRHSVVIRKEIERFAIWPYYVDPKECAEILMQVWRERSKIILAPNRYIRDRHTVFRRLVPDELPSIMDIIFRQWQENESKEEGVSKCQYRRMIIGQ